MTDRWRLRAGRTRPALPLVAVALLLGGCAGEPLRLTAWWPAAEAPLAEPAAPLYCYRNLARVDCYVAPDPQRRH